MSASPLLVTTGLVAALLADGCSGRAAASRTPTEGGAGSSESTTGGTASTHESTTGGTAPTSTRSAGTSCTPTGTWTITYATDEDCIVSPEQLVVEADGDGYLVEYDAVALFGPVPEPTGSVSADGCTVKATGVHSFPATEDGGRVYVLELTVEGDSAHGTMTYGPYSDNPTGWFCRVSGTVSATATRTD